MDAWEGGWVRMAGRQVRGDRPARGIVLGHAAAEEHDARDERGDRARQHSHRRFSHLPGTDGGGGSEGGEGGYNEADRVAGRKWDTRTAS